MMDRQNLSISDEQLGRDDRDRAAAAAILREGKRWGWDLTPSIATLMAARALDAADRAGVLGNSQADPKSSKHLEVVRSAAARLENDLGMILDVTRNGNEHAQVLVDCIERLAEQALERFRAVSEGTDG